MRRIRAINRQIRRLTTTKTSAPRKVDAREQKSQSAADAAREHLAAELDRLRERRDRLEAEVKNDRGTVSDHADAADAIQRADELVGLDERINELDRLLRAGPAPSDGADTLPGGTEVTLRFSDGDVVTMQVISVDRRDRHRPAKPRR